MSRLPIHTLTSAPEQTRPILQKLQARSGTLMNIHATMANSPAVLGAYAAMNAAIAKETTFDARTREAIALTVANADGCDYCQGAHTVLAKNAGFSEADTIAIRRGDIDFDDRLGALLRLVREAARNVGEVTDEAWQDALNAGWTEKDLADTFAFLMANVFTNYFNHYVRTDQDVPAAPSVQAS